MNTTKMFCREERENFLKFLYVHLLANSQNRKRGLIPLKRKGKNVFHETQAYSHLNLSSNYHSSVNATFINNHF